MRLSPNDLAAWVGERLPGFALERLLGQSLRDFGVSLCLHRVADVERPSDWQPGLNMPAAEIDALIEIMRAARNPRASRWLTISFDDGYADAAQYIASRAPRFTDVDFMFFVCPEKLEQRAGFRWDLAEEAIKAGTDKAEAVKMMDAPVDVAAENKRPELHALAEKRDYALANIEQIRELKTLPNVQLGNHTNLHAIATRLSDDQAREDYRRSTQMFTRLFGAQKQFAFPFGTPRHQFDARHVGMLRELGDFTMWSTEPRPFRLTERRPGAVLPRFGINGRMSAEAIAGWVAARALNFRARGSKHHF